ncbi:MAG: hypothetical protein IT229_06810 [Flavobacteriales bacterium]|nr:hypothetical protein [Flavobacteriales bacterium]
MLRRALPYIICILSLSMAPYAAFAQEEGISRAKQEKLQAKEGKEKKKARAKKEKEDRKRHLANQDKATRKRIKRNTKRADRNGTNAHRDPWPGRWFVKH